MLPEYVRCCRHAAEPAPKVYVLWIWNPGDVQHAQRIPYTCNSWRCPGCAPYCASVIFARMKEAFEPYDPAECVFLVLTLDGHLHDLGANDLDALYRDFGRRMQKFRQRLQAWCESRLGATWNNRWCSTLEAHRSGVPHINVVLHAPELAKAARERYNALRALGQSHREATLIWDELAAHAQACGFGPQSTLEAAESKDAVIGYLAKTAKHADRLHAEVSKITQLPLEAPKRFRRLRAAKNFLPARRKGSKTGAIVRRYWTAEGDQESETLVTPKEPQLKTEYERIQRAECNVWRQTTDDFAERVEMRKRGVPSHLLPRAGPPAHAAYHLTAEHTLLVADLNGDLNSEDGCAVLKGPGIVSARKQREHERNKRTNRNA